MTIDAKLGVCINWGGAKTAAGYGTFRENGKPMYAHRASYADSRGVPMESLVGLVVRHKCDNPSCFNPDHLDIGTQADNLRDMRERGRYRLTPESQSKRSASQRRRFAEHPMSDEYREKLSLSHKGHRHSEETKAKMRAAHAGQKHTDAAKQKIRAAWARRKEQQCR